MPQNPDHIWILHVLKDVEAYAKAHDQQKVAAIIHAATGAVNNVLDDDGTRRANTQTKEEQWFDVVLDELARYCHMRGMRETEQHLLAALEAWNSAQETKRINAKVLTFRPVSL